MSTLLMYLSQWVLRLPLSTVWHCFFPPILIIRKCLDFNIKYSAIIALQTIGKYSQPLIMSIKKHKKKDKKHKKEKTEKTEL
jgi:hypothetical protein